MSISTSELDLSGKSPMRELEKRLGVHGDWIEEVNIERGSGLSQPFAGVYCWQMGLAQKDHGDVVCYASEDGMAWAIGPRGKVVPFEREVTLENVGKTLAVKIGRSSINNNIVVQGDPCVSLWHAKIFYSPTRKSFYVMDLGSEDRSKGIWSNGSWRRVNCRQGRSRC
ncbi:FHA domain-containing protein [Candidatus Microgenomates bacterium]|nr:FHA domain-containing protein [Candidatus Microgenomates bacterium]